MQLPDELLKKVRLLTDKPVSPILNRQLHPLLLHENLNIDKTIPILTQKYRSDLLIHLLQNNQYPSNQTMNQMLASIQNNILEYKIPQVLQLYILILAKIDEQKKLLEIGYYDLAKLAVKQPNLETKQKIFQIIVSNSEYLYKRKCKKVIMAIVSNYVDIFSKFLIYVPSYISMIELALEIDRNSKKIINKQHPQREPELQEIFIDLSSKELAMICKQILAILQNTRDKLNYYSLHRNCLNALKKIGEILDEFKVKESQLNFTELDVGQICRTIEIFQDRKGTIDEARFAKSVWTKRFNELRKIKELKSEKYMNVPDIGSLILDKKQMEKPLFIEQVISMANNYRLKYQVSPPEKQESTGSRIVAVSNNFLKKGIGVGGGRTYLLNQKHQSVFQVQKQKNKRLYRGVVDKCFNEIDKDFEYKSFVDPKFINQQPTHVSGRNLQDSEWKIEEPESLKAENSLEFEKIQNLPIFMEEKFQQKRKNSIKKEKKPVSYIQEDDDVVQINSLIQLAYSYKFS